MRRIEHCSRNIRFRHRHQSKVSVGEVGSTQNGATETRSTKVDAPEILTASRAWLKLDNHTGEVGEIHLRLVQIGADEFGFAQLGAL